MNKKLKILLLSLSITIMLFIAFIGFVSSVIGTKTDVRFWDKNEKYSSEIESRDLSVFKYDSLLTRTPYELLIKKKDSVIIFDYNNKVDSTKNISIRYLRYSHKIYFGPFEFSSSIINDYKTKIYFDRYELTESIDDGMGSLLFNQKYGILSFQNGFGKEFYFTTEDNRSQIDFAILD